MPVLTRQYDVHSVNNARQEKRAAYDPHSKGPGLDAFTFFFGLRPKLRCYTEIGGKGQIVDKRTQMYRQNREV